MLYGRPVRRVTITGCGLAGSLGSGWEAIFSGGCAQEEAGATGAHRRADHGGPWRCSDEAPPLEPAAQRCAELSARAAERALEHASLPSHAEARQRAGVVLGTSLGARPHGQRRPAGTDLPNLEEFFLAPTYRPLTRTLAQRIGVNGPVLLNAQACSTGGAALAWGYELVASGQAELILAGGADSAPRGGCAADAGEPHRDGAGILVLEEQEHAEARGAQVLAELAGYGLSHPVHDAHQAAGNAFALAVRQALSTTGTPPEQVDRLFPHATQRWSAEASALRAVFGERADRIRACSMAASLLGASHGATSALEAIAWVLPNRDALPENGRRITESDRSCARASTALNLADGFGASYVCVVLRARRGHAQDAS